MILKVKKLVEDAIIPKYQHGKFEDAGFDLHAVEDVILEPAGIQLSVGEEADEDGEKYDVIYADYVSPDCKIVKTGLAFEVPLGHEMQVRGRSGLSSKHKLHVHLGTVDSSYRGEVGVIMMNLGDKPYEIKKGDRIAQAVINKVECVDFEEADELSETGRGQQGFGSTGK